LFTAQKYTFCQKRSILFAFLFTQFDLFIQGKPKLGHLGT